MPTDHSNIIRAHFPPFGKKMLEESIKEYLSGTYQLLTQSMTQEFLKERQSKQFSNLLRPKKNNLCALRCFLMLQTLSYKWLACHMCLQYTSNFDR